MQVINLNQFRSRDVVATLRELLKAAEQGEIVGLAYIVHVGRNDHRADVAGEYRRDSAKALQATFKLERFLSKTGSFGDSL